MSWWAVGSFCLGGAMIGFNFALSLVNRWPPDPIICWGCLLGIALGGILIGLGLLQASSEGNTHA
jgi:hypothetical protein